MSPSGTSPKYTKSLFRTENQTFLRSRGLPGLTRCRPSGASCRLPTRGGARQAVQKTRWSRRARG